MGYLDEALWRAAAETDRAFLDALGAQLDPWQSDVLRNVYAERKPTGPYRTVAFVTKHRAIERA